jgi:hypothetical protein
MDFEFFRRNILSHDYADISREITGGRDPAERHIPYMLVYNTFRGICKEQREIVDRHEDLIALSAVFSRLPKLTKLGLCFCQTLSKENWVPFFMDRTVGRNTYRHHFHVILDALNAARDHKVFLKSIHFVGLELPYYCSLNTTEAQALRIYLLDIIRCTKNLSLSGSGSPLKSLTHTTLHLQQLHLCCLSVPQHTLREFFQNNANSIESVGFHNVRLICSEFTGTDSVLVSPELCRNGLRITRSVTCWIRSPCVVCGHAGWRLS